jgi:hypothetical protein
MDKLPAHNVVQYASPRPRPRGGELGALPALASLAAGLYGFGASFLAISAAVSVITAFIQSRSVEPVAMLVAGIGLPSGLLALWGAVRISRSCRR